MVLINYLEVWFQVQNVLGWCIPATKRAQPHRNRNPKAKNLAYCPSVLIQKDIDRGDTWQLPLPQDSISVFHCLMNFLFLFFYNRMNCIAPKLRVTSDFPSLHRKNDENKKGWHWINVDFFHFPCSVKKMKSIMKMKCFPWKKYMPNVPHRKHSQRNQSKRWLWTIDLNIIRSSIEDYYEDLLQNPRKSLTMTSFIDLSFHQFGKRTSQP